MRKSTHVVLTLILAASCGGEREAVVLPPQAEHLFVERVANHPGVVWRVDTTDHFIVRGVVHSYSGDNLGSLARGVEQARVRVLQQLGETVGSEGARAHVFLVRDRDDIRELVGQAAGGWTDPDANAVVVAVNDSVPPPLRHELGHLYSHRLWGPPHATWLSEGVAVYAAVQCAGIPLHTWAAAVHRSGDAEPLRVLEHEFDFSRAAPHLLAGSFVLFVAEVHGIAAVRVLWRGGLGSAEQATGKSPAALERAWFEQLQSVLLPSDMPDHKGRVRCETSAG